VQCKDIPDRPVLEFLRDLPYYPEDEVVFPWMGPLRMAGTWIGERPNNVALAMPAGAPPKLVLAKMRMLEKRGLIEGCTCGCRGDFELTEKGTRFLSTP